MRYNNFIKKLWKKRKKKKDKNMFFQTNKQG